jgi:flagellar biosynthetic protein FliR
VNGLDALLAPGAADALVLVALRVGGLILVAPIFASKQVPPRFRVVLLLLLAALVWPSAQRAAAGTVALTPAAALGETMIGMALGFGVALIVGAGEMAGDLIAMSTGLSGASAIDPITFQSTPTLGIFYRLITLTLLFSLDLHLVLIDGLASSFRAIPLGAQIDVAGGARAMAGSATILFITGLRMAAPVVGAVLTLNIALGVLSRAAPQLQVLSVAFSLQTGLGLLVLGGSMPFVAAMLAGWPAQYDHIVGRMLDGFAPHAALVR